MLRIYAGQSAIGRALHSAGMDKDDTWDTELILNGVEKKSRCFCSGPLDGKEKKSSRPTTPNNAEEKPQYTPLLVLFLCRTTTAM